MEPTITNKARVTVRLGKRVQKHNFESGEDDTEVIVVKTDETEANTEIKHRTN
jgi:hypothetical protein